MMDIGIDEVGRGPVAGPVTLSVLAAEPYRIKKLIDYAMSRGIILRDSKKLSAVERGRWLSLINKFGICYRTSSIGARDIDKYGISIAVKIALDAGLRRCLGSSGISAKDVRIYLDGSLYLRGQRRDNTAQKIHPFRRVQTIIKGDERISVISLASIVAKMHRDRLMTALHKKYPVYGFCNHKGYGTKQHLLAIKKYGTCPVHRLTFLTKYCNLKSK